MFGIVWLHAGTFGAYGEAGTAPNRWIVHFKYMLAVTVDVFAFISGWFGVRFSAKKFCSLIGLSVICGTVAFLASHYMFGVAEMNLGTFVYYCSTNWYFNGYLVLMLLSPVINAGLEKFEKGNLKAVLIPFLILYVWQFLASIVPETHVSGVGRAYFSRYSFLTLVMIYIAGRLVRKTGFLEKAKTGMLLAVAIVLAPFTAFPPLHYYTSPILFVEAMCIFEMFRRIRIPRWLGNVSVFLAPSMFSVLLLHRYNDLCYRMFIPLEGEILGSLNPFVSVFIAACVVFAVCVMIDFVRRGVKWSLKKTVLKPKLLKERNVTEA